MVVVSDFFCHQLVQRIFYPQWQACWRCFCFTSMFLKYWCFVHFQNFNSIFLGVKSTSFSPWTLNCQYIEVLLSLFPDRKICFLIPEETNSFSNIITITFLATFVHIHNFYKQLPWTSEINSLLHQRDFHIQYSSIGLVVNVILLVERHENISVSSKNYWLLILLEVPTNQESSSLVVCMCSNFIWYLILYSIFLSGLNARELQLLKYYKWVPCFWKHN